MSDGPTISTVICRVFLIGFLLDILEELEDLISGEIFTRTMCDRILGDFTHKILACVFLANLRSDF